jgi:sRNA-binding protein
MSKETALGAALKAAVQTMSKKKQTDMIADHVYGKYEVFRRFRPLAIGIDQALTAELPQFDPTLVARVLANHCRRPRYIKALAQGGKRFGLDGKPVGQVTPEEQEVARQNPALQPQAKPAAADAVDAAPAADATPVSDAE